MKNMIKDAAVLFVITVAAGLILGFVYQITKEPIALAEEKAANEAYAEVFADASSFEECALADPAADPVWTEEYKAVDIEKRWKRRTGREVFSATY